MAQGGQSGSRLPTLGSGLSSPGLDTPILRYSVCWPQAIPGLHFHRPFPATAMLTQVHVPLGCGWNQATLLYLCLEHPHNPTGSKARNRELFCTLHTHHSPRNSPPAPWAISHGSMTLFRGTFPNLCPLKLPRPGCGPDLGDSMLSSWAPVAMGETVCCDPHLHFCGGQRPVTTSCDWTLSSSKPKVRGVAYEQWS